ncbi:hypothetical protein HYU19_00515 [Candidatus Woesearchaeota archaeon]|nr:hypothetical protein [Candidatus Woesearchaeota archaeon]
MNDKLFEWTTLETMVLDKPKPVMSLAELRQQARQAFEQDRAAAAPFLRRSTDFLYFPAQFNMGMHRLFPLPPDSEVEKIEGLKPFPIVCGTEQPGWHYDPYRLAAPEEEAMAVWKEQLSPDQWELLQEHYREMHIFDMVGGVVFSISDGRGIGERTILPAKAGTLTLNTKSCDGEQRLKDGDIIGTACTLAVYFQEDRYKRDGQPETAVPGGADDPLIIHPRRRVRQPYTTERQQQRTLRLMNWRSDERRDRTMISGNTMALDGAVYTNVLEIGEGVMGRVYCAVSPAGSPVAIKKARTSTGYSSDVIKKEAAILLALAAEYDKARTTGHVPFPPAPFAAAKPYFPMVHSSGEGYIVFDMLDADFGETFGLDFILSEPSPRRYIVPAHIAHFVALNHAAGIVISDSMLDNKGVGVAIESEGRGPVQTYCLDYGGYARVGDPLLHGAVTSQNITYHHEQNRRQLLARLLGWLSMTKKDLTASSRDYPSPDIDNHTAPLIIQNLAYRAFFEGDVPGIQEICGAMYGLLQGSEPSHELHRWPERWKLEDLEKLDRERASGTMR